MTRIVVLGGTGYTGSAVVREAASRGHEVVSYSRSIPGDDARVPGVTYVTGSLLDPDVRAQAVADAAVVVSALSPRGELDGRIVEVDREVAVLAAGVGARLVVVGGFSSLRPAADAPRFAEGDDIPPQFAAEAKQMYEVLETLIQTPETLDWVFFSPAQQYGSYVPGDALGRYRVGDEVAFFDAEGVSAISGADFALAIMDEVDRPTHHRVNVSVAY